MLTRFSGFSHILNLRQYSVIDELFKSLWFLTASWGRFIEKHSVVVVKLHFPFTLPVELFPSKNSPTWFNKTDRVYREHIMWISRRFFLFDDVY